VRSREETNARMKEYRQQNKIKFEAMSKKAQISGALLGHLESGDWITHPHIASRVCAAYGLDVDDYNNLVHEEHRVTRLPQPVPPPKKSGYYD